MSCEFGEKEADVQIKVNGPWTKLRPNTEIPDSRDIWVIAIEIFHVLRPHIFDCWRTLVHNGEQGCSHNLSEKV